VCSDHRRLQTGAQNAMSGNPVTSNQGSAEAAPGNTRITWVCRLLISSAPPVGLN
jgi:hypothetical protein